MTAQANTEEFSITIRIVGDLAVRFLRLLARLQERLPTAATLTRNALAATLFRRGLAAVEAEEQGR